MRLKTKLMFIILCVAGCSIISCSLKDDKKEIIKPDIVKQEIESLIDKDKLGLFKKEKVSTFIDSIFEKYDNYYFIDEPPGKIIGAEFFYEKYTIIIYISTRNFVKPFNASRRWNLSDFMIEEISSIVVSKREGFSDSEILRI